MTEPHARRLGAGGSVVAGLVCASLASAAGAAGRLHEIPVRFVSEQVRIRVADSVATIEGRYVFQAGELATRFPLLYPLPHRISESPARPRVRGAVSPDGGPSPSSRDPHEALRPPRCGGGRLGKLVP
jgi:hypothetical protein